MGVLLALLTNTAESVYSNNIFHLISTPSVWFFARSCGQLGGATTSICRASYLETARLKPWLRTGLHMFD